MKPKVLVHRMRLVPSTLHLPMVLAYTMRELVREGETRVFEYFYVEAQRIQLGRPSATEDAR